MSESKLLRATMQAIERIPDAEVIRMQSGTVRKGSRFIRMCEPGTPDLLVMRPNGRCVWLEIKRADGKGRVSAVQSDWHRKAEKLGHAVYVIESVQNAIQVVLDTR
jgi:hypothetical protein